jgi:hypothetical protein
VAGVQSEDFADGSCKEENGIRGSKILASWRTGGAELEAAYWFEWRKDEEEEG